jgi:zinc transporter ZupT
MVLGLDVWLMPAIAAGSSSYLVSLCWERLRIETAPSGLMAAFLSALSFIMGGISAYYRYGVYSSTPENNIIVMFVVGASTTFIWLRFRRLLPGLGERDRSRR